MSSIDLSFVIPVYNAMTTIGPLAERILRLTAHIRSQIVLVNDGSADSTESICRDLVRKYPSQITFVHLARNFGEHNAVLAGLHQARGDYAVVLDDDGQNPPEEAMRLYEHIKKNNFDCVYGRYAVKQHHWARNLGSRFNDKMANLMLKKPKDIYLSSFKVMNRFLVGEVTRYNGSFPYIDGLIFRATRSIAQIEVQHESAPRPSNYNLRRLVRLWLNMFLNFSITPLRISALLGFIVAALSIVLIAFIIIDKIWINPGVTVGIPTVLAAITFFAGVQLLILGVVGEYLGRMFLDSSQMPQFVVRYIEGAHEPKR